MLVGDLQVYIKHNNILWIKNWVIEGKKHNDKDIISQKGKLKCNTMMRRTSSFEI